MFFVAPVIGGLLWAGCSPDAPLSESELAAAGAAECGELTYQNFGARFFADYCLPCHNDQLRTDVARSDAPLGIDFNRLDGIRTFQKRIRLRAGELGDMPPRLLPVARPTPEERILLIQWLDCGAPGEADQTEP